MSFCRHKLTSPKNTCLFISEVFVDSMRLHLLHKILVNHAMYSFNKIKCSKWVRALIIVLSLHCFHVASFQLSNERSIELYKFALYELLCFAFINAIIASLFMQLVAGIFWTNRYIFWRNVLRYLTHDILSINLIHLFKLTIPR